MDQPDGHDRDDPHAGRRHNDRPPPAAGPTGPPDRVSKRRRWSAWLLLAAAVAAIVAGIGTGRGVVLATGLVLAVAAQLLLTDHSTELRHPPHQ